MLQDTSILDNKRVLELGSGTGLGGLVAALFAQQVVLTDFLQPVLQLLEHNIRMNCRRDECLFNSEPHVEALDWSDFVQEDGNWAGQRRQFRAFDGLPPELIIGSDLIYSEQHAAKLADTISYFLSSTQFPPCTAALVQRNGRPGVEEFITRLRNVHGCCVRRESMDQALGSAFLADKFGPGHISEFSLVLVRRGL
jgi:hypothetical protein